MIALESLPALAAYALTQGVEHGITPIANDTESNGMFIFWAAMGLLATSITSYILVTGYQTAMIAKKFRKSQTPSESDQSITNSQIETQSLPRRINLNLRRQRTLDIDTNHDPLYDLDNTTEHMPRPRPGVTNKKHRT